MAAPVVPGELDDQAAIEARFVQWRPQFETNTKVEEYQLRQLVIESLRIEKCQRQDFALRSRMQARARASWVLDRKSEIQAIASKLPRNPDRWRVELLRSAHGCRWMISQWKGLKSALKAPGGWNARMRSQALDLLGVPTLFRDGLTPLDPRPGDSPDTLELFIKDQIDSLESLLKDSHDELDAFERQCAEEGIRLNLDREVAALLRLEAGCQRRFDRLWNQLQRRHTVKSEKPTNPSANPGARTSAVSTYACALKPGRTIANETERWSDRNRPSLQTQTSRSEPVAPEQIPAPPRSVPAPSPKGNRQERRRAAALARKK